MLQTVEARWFFADRPPLDYQYHVTPETELQCRSDWYSMPTHPLCGIKLREGKLELKLRCDLGPPLQIAPWDGIVEEYRKWSLPCEPPVGPTERELGTVGWCEVKKRRYLQRMEVEDEQIRPVTTRPSNGCEFEFTELEVAGQNWWTVGFEAVGTTERRLDNLVRVARYVADRDGLLEPFCRERSFGYATWLANLGSSQIS